MRPSMCNFGSTVVGVYADGWHVMRGFVDVPQPWVATFTRTWVGSGGGRSWQLPQATARPPPFQVGAGGGSVTLLDGKLPWQ